MIWTSLRTLLYLAAAALLVNAARVQFSSRATAMVNTGGAYTLTLVEQTSNGKAGPIRLASIQTWGRRSDGATVLKLGAGTRTSHLITMASGLTIRTNDVLKARSTIVVPPPVTPVLRDAQNLCRRSDDSVAPAAQEILTGLRVARFVEKASDRTSTSFYAIDFGCAAVGREMTFADGSISHLRLASFTAGEPNASLFNVADDYREVPPSELREEHEKAHCSDSCQARLKRQDDDYYRLTPKR
jgi:hypothetical protein